MHIRCMLSRHIINCVHLCFRARLRNACSTHLDRMRVAQGRDMGSLEHQQPSGSQTSCTALNDSSPAAPPADSWVVVVKDDPREGSVEDSLPCPPGSMTRADSEAACTIAPVQSCAVASTAKRETQACPLSASRTDHAHGRVAVADA